MSRDEFHVEDVNYMDNDYACVTHIATRMQFLLRRDHASRSMNTRAMLSALVRSDDMTGVWGGMLAEAAQIALDEVFGGGVRAVSSVKVVPNDHAIQHSAKLFTVAGDGLDVLAAIVNGDGPT